jgi:TolB-like protein
MSSYFDELKRRNVFRVGAAYAVVGWLTIEVVDTIAPRMAMPEWVPGFFIILVLIGFPIALLFSWAFELTPEGIKKTAEVDADESITSNTGQKINYFIIAALLAFILFQQFAPSLRDLAPFAAGTTEAQAIAIAVLPFADLSADRDQEYLGDGVAEEILNVLAGIDGLKVTSRTSAFAFKGQNIAIPEIANILRVSHVVEGSIRKQNDQVRITAQLINVEDDSHLWSDTFDSDLSNIFRLQDEIADFISAALSSELGLTLAGVDRETPDWDVGAYELYLRARQQVVARENFEEPIRLLDAALMIEPDFADAWAEKGAALALLGFQQSYYDEDFPASLASYELSWAAAQRATELEPGHPLGLAVQGLVRMNQKRWIEARVYFERAISVNNPNDYAFLWLGILQALTGDTEGAITTFESRLEESPSAPNLVRWQVQTLESLGRSGIIWDSKAASGKTAQPETVFTKQTAGLQLGKISIDEFVAWFETISPDMSAEQRAAAITLIRTLHDDPEAAIDTAVWDVLKQQGAFKLVRSYAIAIGKNYARHAAVERINLIAAQPNDNSLTLFWSDAASSVRQSSEFHEMVRTLDLPTYWDLYGWPPACLRTGTNDFECN